MIFNKLEGRFASKIRHFAYSDSERGVITPIFLVRRLRFTKGVREMEYELKCAGLIKNVGVLFLLHQNNQFPFV